MTVILLDSGTRKARKTHQCFHCYRPIPRGEEYSFSTCKHDRVYTLAMHQDCLAAANFFMDTILDAHPFNLDYGYPPLMDMVWDNDGQDDIDALRGKHTWTTGEEQTGGSHLDWVIVGGESGPNARPMRLDHARDVVRQCQAAGVPVFVKQLGRQCVMNRHDAVQPVGLGAGWDVLEPGSDHGIVTFRHRKGGDPIEWPKDMRVQQFPEAA